MTYPRGGREIVSRKRKRQREKKVSRKNKIVEKSKDSKRRILGRRGFRKSCFVSREIFIFKTLERVHSLTEVVLGENIGFSRRTAESAISNPGIYGIMQP